MREIGNEWEAQNRGIKVARLLAAANALGMDAWTVALDENARARLLTETGIAEASKTTWEWLVKAMQRNESRPVDTAKMLRRCS